MGEQVTHSGCIYDAENHEWNYAGMIVDFDPDDGTRLNAYGTTTERCDVVTFANLNAGPVPAPAPVEAVTPDAVQGTDLVKLLTQAERGWDDCPDDEIAFLAEDGVGIGLLDEALGLTDEGHTILSSLQQSAPRRCLTPPPLQLFPVGAEEGRSR